MKEILDYEARRAARIRQNENQLKALGLLNNFTQQKTVDKITKRPIKSNLATKLEPTRSSQRLRGRPALSLLPESSSIHANSRIKVKTLQKSESHSIYYHTMMRIQTMSEKALKTRIGKLQSFEKLSVFLQCLKESQMHTLAKDAEKRLKEWDQL